MLLGNPGRPVGQPRPLQEVEEDERPSGTEAGWAFPSTCLRVLSSPNQPGCPVDCPGRQRDGGCLLTITRAAAAAGVKAEWEIDSDGYWVYVGPPLPATD